MASPGADDSNPPLALPERLIETVHKPPGIRPIRLHEQVQRAKQRVTTLAVGQEFAALRKTALGITKTHSRPYTSSDNPYSVRTSRR
jgi:hypothetical protein